MFAAFAAGLLAQRGTLPGEAEGKSHWVQAVELSTAEFGMTAGKIAFVSMSMMMSVGGKVAPSVYFLAVTFTVNVTSLCTFPWP